MLFMEEFIKKHSGAKANDEAVYYDLTEEDKGNVDEVLKGLGICYADLF